MRQWVIALAAAISAAVGPTAAQRLPAAIAQDPASDKAHPAVMLAEAIPSHGDNLNAVFYAAAVAGPRPTVLLLHGLPGNEQNLDLGQAIRRDGWNERFHCMFHDRPSDAGRVRGCSAATL